MNNQRWILYKRIIGYEWYYIFRKFKLGQKILLFVALLAVVITGLGDTQSFFLGENSPIPQTWKLLKDPRIDDLPIIKINELHSLALDWIIEYTSSVGLLWRMKNNI
ncbi:MAG: hypothetical protein QNJ42_23525 [Crocosphaera sp.]|nr:hypothetical protein [Crocosphaera sp.]